jgi:hypothetical protein
MSEPSAETADTRENSKSPDGAAGPEVNSGAGSESVPTGGAGPAEEAEPEAGLVGPGSSYPETGGDGAADSAPPAPHPSTQFDPFSVEHGAVARPTISRSDYVNAGSAARAVELTAEATKDNSDFERDGVQVHDGSKVYVKTYRIGTPAHEHLPEHAILSLMRGVIEDVAKAGEIPISHVQLHKVKSNEKDLHRSSLWQFFVRLH